jgi:hypothetical protein
MAAVVIVGRAWAALVTVIAGAVDRTSLGFTPILAWCRG